jgi:ATP-dependent DNA helicase RecG
VEPSDLKKRIDKGEDSFQQFKVRFSSIDNLAVEISAFANGGGGKIMVGVSDKGQLTGLNPEEIRKHNQWTSNSTSQKIEPPIFVQTEVIEVDKKYILIISVPRGMSKPYSVNKDQFWVKNGSDKRRATRDELFRLLQSSSALYADEMKTEILKKQFDFLYFSEFYKQVYDEDLEDLQIERDILLENLKLVHENHLTLAGVLLFGKSVETLKPQFGIKATCYLTEDEYRDKEDIGGKLFEQHRKGVDFILRNLHRTQESEDFNSPGELEIPAVAIKEAVANALVHRDYFYNTSIFINVYADRVEVVSPGKLPNTVTLEGVKLGIHMERNPILLSFIAKNQEMGYTGRGSGIPRMIRLCKRRQTPLEFINDSQREQFRVIFRRKAR